MKYIALDLETTWLDPRHDTIIEIAAIRFGVEETRIVPEEEHSMLVAPWFPLSHQVSMITGITNTMLEGRQSWEQIRMNVQQFIDTGDIFVWHNVSLDISFLEAHGITFPKQNGAIQTLDTFELAQIFSLESESLNLAFLCKKYALGWGWEHRALEDVKMSLSLLSFYLQKDLTHYEDAVLRFFCEHEKIQSSISLFCDLK